MCVQRRHIMGIELICGSCAQYIGVKYKISSRGNKEIIKLLFSASYHNDLQCAQCKHVIFSFLIVKQIATKPSLCFARVP